MYIAIIHLLFVAPLLIYVGFVKPTFVWVYYALVALGVGVFLNFGSKVITQKWSQRTVWYVIHALLFALLLLYVGLNGRQSSDVSFSLLLAVGLGAFTYHLLRLIQHRGR